LSSANRYLPIVGYVLVAVAFWSLRVTYWSITPEEPFSDMKDLIDVASAFLKAGSLGMGDFWQAYKVPVVPLMMAMVFGVAGEANLDAWRIAQTMFVFIAMVWLAREIYLRCASHLLALGLLCCVAFARSSIFWSLKPATESIAEGLVYLIPACALWHARRQNVFSAATLGFVIVVATLARPNFLVLLPVFGLWLLWLHWAVGKPNFRSRTVFAAFCLGVALAWSPWIARNYALYRAFVPISTQGPYTFLWELGQVRATLPDGTKVETTVQQLQQDAGRNFKSDYEASRYAQALVRAWLSENWKPYLRLVMHRGWQQLTDTTEYLTKVPRDRLFTDGFEPLLDKSLPLVMLGLLGLALFPLARPWALPIGLIPWTVWPFGALFIGYSRMFEPLLPLSLFGVVALIYIGASLLSGLVRMEVERAR
jgi:hypothetical protein